MPEFTTVSLHEAQLRTIPGRQGRFLNEYVAYINQLPSGQAGKLHVLESENPLTIRRRLVSAAKALDMKLIIKRSGENIYFWREDGAGEEPRPRRGRRPRRQESRLTRQEETATPEQYFRETGELDQEVPQEESPELGQLASEAERRVEQG
jgi:hypothetical protein